MRISMRIVLLCAALCFGISIGSAWCADETAPAEPAAESTAAPAATGTAETGLGADMQWVWAEVVSVDPINGQMTLKYLDYETDAEKEMTMAVDNQTAYENVKALVEIKPSDTVSIDYVITSDGKNLARNVNVEKAEGIEPMPEETSKIPREEEKAPAAAAQPAEQPQAQSQPAEQTSPAPDTQK